MDEDIEEISGRPLSNAPLIWLIGGPGGPPDSGGPVGSMVGTGEKS